MQHFQPEKWRASWVGLWLLHLGLGFGPLALCCEGNVGWFSARHWVLVGNQLSFGRQPLLLVFLYTWRENFRGAVLIGKFKSGLQMVFKPQHLWFVLVTACECFLAWPAWSSPCPDPILAKFRYLNLPYHPLHGPRPWKNVYWAIKGGHVICQIDCMNSLQCEPVSFHMIWGFLD